MIHKKIKLHRSLCPMCLKPEKYSFNPMSKSARAHTHAAQPGDAQYKTVLLSVINAAPKPISTAHAAILPRTVLARPSAPTLSGSGAPRPRLPSCLPYSHTIHK